MLVLSRKIGEQIIIDDEITITVIRIEGSRVKIGIDAPEEYRIRRGELVEQWQSSAETKAMPPTLTS